jgi:hypothetical protein
MTPSTRLLASADKGREVVPTGIAGYSHVVLIWCDQLDWTQGDHLPQIIAKVSSTVS